MTRDSHSNFSIEIELDESWVQSRYEHVHHGRCLSLLEQGRLALLSSIGFPIDGLLDRGLALVIVRVEVAYKREIRKGRVVVSCESPVIEGRTLRVTQRLWNEHGKVAVEATADSMFMDIASRRGIDPPLDFREAFTGWAAVDTKN